MSRLERLALLAGFAAAITMGIGEPVFPRDTSKKKRYKKPIPKTNIGRDNKQFKIKGIRP